MKVIFVEKEHSKMRHFPSTVVVKTFSSAPVNLGID